MLIKKKRNMIKATQIENELYTVIVCRLKSVRKLSSHGRHRLQQNRSQRELSPASSSHLVVKYKEKRIKPRIPECLVPVACHSDMAKQLKG